MSSIRVARESDSIAYTEAAEWGTFPSAPPLRAPSKVHLPGLDGVRAIAILMVIVYHAVNDLSGTTRAQNLFLRLAGQGWMGVDLFFVLSGFLITGILLDVRTSAHALRNFYARRFLRIVPLYVAYLLFSLWLATKLGTSSADEAAQLHRTQLWYWTYSVNILVALHNWGASTFPMAHLWSLSVEEQFYLLWPLAVLALSPHTLRRTALVCIVAAELCRLAFVVGGAGGQVNYVLLPSRMDSLAAGAFLACAYREPALWSRVLRARQGLMIVALLALLVTVLVRHTIDGQASFEQLVLFPAIVALAVVMVSSGASRSAWRPGTVMRFLGKISYGMYVWHVVAIRLLLSRITIPDNARAGSWWLSCALLTTGAIVGTVIFALVSWYLIEQPFLRLKRFVPSG